MIKSIFLGGGFRAWNPLFGCVHCSGIFPFVDSFCPPQPTSCFLLDSGVLGGIHAGVQNCGSHKASPELPCTRRPKLRALQCA